MIEIVVLALIVVFLAYLLGHADGRRCEARKSVERIRREINRARVLRG